MLINGTLRWLHKRTFFKITQTGGAFVAQWLSVPLFCTGLDLTAVGSSPVLGSALSVEPTYKKKKNALTDLAGWEAEQWPPREVHI